MTYQAEQVLQPRSFIYSSNANALVLESVTSETKLTFLNSMRSSGLIPNYTLGSYNEYFHLSKDDQRISTFDVPYNNLYGKLLPRQTVYGSFCACNITMLPGDGTKSLVLYDFNDMSENQYAGFSYAGGIMQHQLPIRTSRFVFQSAAMDGINVEWMRIQESDTGLAQVGIGMTNISSNVALAVAGDTYISGTLKVLGALDFNPATFSNFVKYDSNTQRVPLSALPSNLPLLNVQNKIDESMIPQSFNFQYLKTQKNVGIGTRYPAQKFHVHGSGVFSERIGIGTLHPVARCHLFESSGTVPTMLLQNMSGGSALEAYSTNLTRPALIIPGTHSGVGINTSVVNVGNALDVNGNAYVNGLFMCSNLQLYSKFQVPEIDIPGVFKTGLKVINSYPMPVQTSEFAVNAPVIIRSELAVNTISATSTFGDVTIKNSSLFVEANTSVMRPVLTLADNSSIFNRNRIQSADALAVVKMINAYTYNLNASETVAGVVGNDLRALNLNALVSYLPNGQTGVRYDGIIAYLIESVKQLDAENTSLRNTVTSLQNAIIDIQNRLNSL